MYPRYVLTIVVPIAALCAAGLLAVQAFWFREALQLKEEQFEEKVFVLLSRTGENLREDNSLTARLAAFLENAPSTKEGADTMLAVDLRQLLKATFQTGQLNTPFFYAIRQGCAPSVTLLSNLSTHQLQQVDFQNEEVLSCLLPGDFQAYTIGLHFPEKQRYLFSQTSGMLAVSLALLVLLLGAFAWLLRVLQQQKKLEVLKNDFINNLSHELKTPIASIALAAKVLEKSQKKQPHPEEQECLRLIGTEAKRLENQVDKVLQMAMVDAGNYSIEKKPVPVHEVLEKVVESFKLMIKERQCDIVTDFRAERSIVPGDAANLFNLFYNLLDNALKYSPNRPEISIVTRVEQNGLACSVSDRGIGMDEKTQRSIFGKFYRASNGNVQPVKGFGLGLSYVKSIVQAHNGNIRFKSAPNEGSEFTVWLPLGNI